MISTHTLRKEGDDYIISQSQGNVNISTHTLRKEGDLDFFPLFRDFLAFQPTPSARRVTNRKHHLRVIQLISTHTLRKEGDGGDAGA